MEKVATLLTPGGRKASRGRSRLCSGAARGRLLLLALGLLLALSAPASWAETKGTISVVMDNTFVPFSFLSPEGELKGILVDQWKAWERQTGIKVELHAMDWNEGLERMRAGEFDVMESLIQSPERERLLDFVPASCPTQASVFFRKEITGLVDLASLKGFPVGVKVGDLQADRLKESGVSTLIPFPNYEAIVEAARDHKINIFLMDDPAALYFLNKMGLEDEFRHSPPIFQDELHRAVRKGDNAMLRKVADGFSAIPAEKMKEINERWFGQEIDPQRRYVIYALCAVSAALLLAAALSAGNRTLKKGQMIRESREQLRALSARLESLREEERKEIAREIHDDLGQKLTGLKLDLRGAEQKIEEMETSPALNSLLDTIVAATELTDQIADTVREMATNLRPDMLDKLGLSATLRFEARRFRERTKIVCRTVLPEAEPQLCGGVATALYRIAQECLTNIARHARATTAEVVLAVTSDGVSLRVQDDGRGVSREELADPRSLGLLGMRERVALLGGEITFEGRPGAGTMVSVRLPTGDAKVNGKQMT